jgi:hypothetical protein
MLRVLFFACALLPLVTRAANPADVDRLVRQALGSPAPNHLAGYAGALPRKPERYESFTETARRIVAGEPSAAKQPPDQTALQLEQLAAALTRSSDPREQIAGYQARFHAHRAIAAVRYQLFRRSQKLAELVAATYGEKDAVRAWRAAVIVATDARLPSAGALAAELKIYEASLKDLEEQCCPPDESVMKEKIWQPARGP